MSSTPALLPPESTLAALPRPQQADYASAVSEAFAPRESEGMPRMVLAEWSFGLIALRYALRPPPARRGQSGPGFRY